MADIITTQQVVGKNMPENGYYDIKSPHEIFQQTVSLLLIYFSRENF